MTGTSDMVRKSKRTARETNIKLNKDCTGPVVRTAPNHLSFNAPQAIKDCYGFGKTHQPKCLKDPEFFLESVYGSWNIINENSKEEHARMRKMLSHAFSTKALLEQEPVICGSVDNFMHQIGTIKAEGGKNGVDITKWFNHVTFDILGAMAFGDSFGARVGNYGPKSREYILIFLRMTNFSLTDLLTVSHHQMMNTIGFRLCLTALL
jgi:hypothetical protein